MREIITRYGRHNIGFMWMFVGPMLFVLVILAIRTTMRTEITGGISIVGFGVTGYSAAFLWRNMPNRCILAVEPNVALMYHRNVKVLDIYASRILLEAVGETMAFILLSFFFTFLGWMEAPVDVLKVLTAWFMLAWFGAALAITLGSLSELHPIVANLWRPISFLTIVFSGAMFMVDWLPEAARNLLLYLPMIHGMEMLREGYFGVAIHAHYDFSYMAICCLGLTLMGLALVKVAERKVTLL